MARATHAQPGHFAFSALGGGKPRANRQVGIDVALDGDAATQIEHYQVAILEFERIALAYDYLIASDGNAFFVEITGVFLCRFHLHSANAVLIGRNACAGELSEVMYCVDLGLDCYAASHC
jgi:hypothetical protein